MIATGGLYQPMRASNPNQSAAMADEILIVGGGFAGFWAAMAARRVAGNNADVTMVSREPGDERKTSGLGS